MKIAYALYAVLVFSASMMPAHADGEHDQSKRPVTHVDPMTGGLSYKERRAKWYREELARQSKKLPGHTKTVGEEEFAVTHGRYQFPEDVAMQRRDKTGGR
ncbi:MAG: hypothetical protein EKK48_31030 [Candidatus Melainabacteria bacterium]|nr:MAG: hypothetical protein EKK48_31030 [Candidatus Melainabacteria bacterium]